MKEQKKLFAQTISEEFIQTVPPFPFKISIIQAERVRANCSCKLFLFGWFFWGGGLPSLDHCRLKLRREILNCSTFGPSDFRDPPSLEDRNLLK